MYDPKKFEELSKSIKLKIDLAQAEGHKSYRLSDSIKTVVSMENINTKKGHHKLPVFTLENKIFATNLIKHTNHAVFLPTDTQEGATIVYKQHDKYCYGMVASPPQNAHQQTIYVQSLSEDEFINIHLDHPFLINTVVGEKNIQEIQGQE